MAAKRKLTDVDTGEPSAEATPAGTERTESRDKKISSAKNYPRKRVAVACEVCRVRKTRCDAAKPSCGFCSDLGVECRYKLPGGGWDKPRAPSPNAFDALGRIEAKLAQLEEKIDLASRDGGVAAIVAQTSPFSVPSLPSQVILQPTDNISSVSEDIHPQAAHPRRAISFASTSRPVAEFAFRQTQGEAIAARPSLLTFHCPPFLNAEGWDDTKVFYDDEMAAGEQLHIRMQASSLGSCDLSRKTTRYLQQSFVENFLRWMPICDLQDCVLYVNRAYAYDFDRSDAASCFAMLVFAIGAVSEGRIGTIGEELPGLNYFAQGSMMLGGMSLMTRSLTFLQCRVLQASYYQFSIRPLQAWNVISQASRDCMHMLSSSLPQNELEAVVKMHPIGLRHFHDLVPLPSSRNEEVDLYYFLAQASLRKLLMESLYVVGHQSGQVIYAPVVTAELRNQIKEWYSHLPPAICFPVDASPLFDSRKSFLRMQYIALFVVIGWPSVLQILESSRSGELGLETSQELIGVREQAGKCLSGCALLISVAEQTLAKRNLGSQLTLWAQVTLGA